MSKRNVNHQTSDNKKAKTVERPEDKDKFCTWYVVFPKIWFIHKKEGVRTMKWNSSHSTLCWESSLLFPSLCSLITFLIRLFHSRTLGTKQNCPHVLAPRKQVPKIMDTVLGTYEKCQFCSYLLNAYCIHQTKFISYCSLFWFAYIWIVLQRK